MTSMCVKKGVISNLFEAGQGEWAVFRVAAATDGGEATGLPEDSWR
jgi:hypothetical protein